MGLTEMALEPLHLPRPRSRLDNRQERTGEGGLTEEREQEGALSLRELPRPFTCPFCCRLFLNPLTPLLSPHSHFVVSFSFTENVEAAGREHPRASARLRPRLSRCALPRLSLSSLRGSFSAPPGAVLLSRVPSPHLLSVALLIFGFLPLRPFSVVRGGCGVGVE